MRPFILLVSCLSLSACYYNKPVRPAPKWQQEGISEEDVKSAYSQCVYEVGMNIVNKEEQARLINACMQKDGYRFK